MSEVWTEVTTSRRQGRFREGRGCVGGVHKIIIFLQLIRFFTGKHTFRFKRVDIPFFLVLTKQANKTQAEKCIDAQRVKAQLSGLKKAYLLCKHTSHTLPRNIGLLFLSYLDHSLEGTNNKNKTLQRQAYVFNDRELFVLKIYALHELKYASL